MKRKNISTDSLPSKNIQTDSSVLDTITFSFDRLSSEKYSPEKCNLEDLNQLMQQMRNLSQLTWNQVDSASRKGLGYEKIPLAEVKAPTDMFKKDRAVVFRFNGEKPMLGYREGNTYHLVYLDHDFTAYPHGRKGRNR